MERDKTTPVAVPAYEPAPDYAAIPLESRSAPPVDLERNNAPSDYYANSTANRTWFVRVFSVRTDTLDEAERRMRTAGLMFALLTMLGISIMIGSLIALYLETK